MCLKQSFFAKIVLVCFMISFIFPVFSLATDSVFVWSEDTTTSTVNASTTQTENSTLLNLESGGAVLIEQNTGKVLYDHNMHEKLRPASVTKVMTILLIMEALDSGRITLDTRNSL